ncbi:MAG: TadE/TadG family type IV pilus assembly protein [Paracoccaceae bacterium]
MKSFRNSLRSFAKDESGVLLAEFLLMVPFMIWGLMALFVYWEVFRTINVTQKAAYSIADLLSRQAVVTTNFVDGLENVLDFLTPGTQDARLRITSLEYDAGNDEYVLLFSRSPGNTMPEHDSVSIQELRSKIPTMDDLDSVVVVETWVDYNPSFDTGVLNLTPGVSNQTLTQFIVTRPRTRRVCLDGTPGCV